MGMGYLLGPCPPLGCLGRTKPIIWFTNARPTPSGEMSHFVYSGARKTNRWEAVDEWGKDLHWSADFILQVGGAPCVPYVRVACLQQVLREAEARTHTATKDAANVWLDKHWRPWTILQGTTRLRHAALGAVLHVFRKDWISQSCSPTK